MESVHLDTLIEYYRAQGAPADQLMLIALLRDVQAANGGFLTQSILQTISDAYPVRPSILHALIRRVPSLHTEDAPHRLEICGTCRHSADLAGRIEEKYRVRSGDCSQSGRFSYQVTGCMKNCKNGPSIRWDGQLYSRADMKLIEQLISRGHN